MTLTTLLLLFLLFLYVDYNTKIVVVLSIYVFLFDYLFWLTGNDWYYERIIIQDIFLAIVCFCFKNKNLIVAGIVCLLSASVMSFEYFHKYQSIIYPYLTTIQFILMQSYLFALGYIKFDRRSHVNHSRKDYNY